MYEPKPWSNLSSKFDTSEKDRENIEKRVFVAKNTDGGAAFPFGTRRYDGGNHYLGTEYDQGMSLRDWFASQAIAAIIKTRGDVQWEPALYARASYQIADAMIAERKKETK